jgi:hypothetical protein
MGRLENGLQRFRHRLPKMDFINKKHSDCINFDNGTCIVAPYIFNLSNLPPKGPACPHFEARNFEKLK